MAGTALDLSLAYPVEGPGTRRCQAFGGGVERAAREIALRL